MEYVVKIYGIYRSYQDIREEYIREYTGLNIHLVSLPSLTKDAIIPESLRINHKTYPTCSDMKKTEPVEK